MANKKSGKRNIPLVGLLAVKNQLITKEDLQTCLSKCSGSSDLSKALQEYLVSNKLVTPKNIQRLLRASKAFELRQKELKFGAIAIRKGFISQSVLKLVLEEQQSDIKAKKKIRMIGDMLVEAGMLSLKQKEQVLKLQKQAHLEIETHKDLDQKSKDADKPVPENDGQTAGETGPAESGETGKKSEPQEFSEPEIIAGGISLEIAGDLMAAFLSKTDYFDEDITVAQIKEALLDKGIVLGTVADEMIQGFIKSTGFKTKSFRVAKGVQPIKGKDARVEFFFNTDFLKAGGMTEDGTIDFKERGEVPFVEEGTVLAEKVPLVESRDGHNIYGDEIPTVPGNDIELKLGKGAKLSEDGFKVLAANKGFPKYTLSGHIFVHDVYVTEGDVDYETGHVQYDGNVDVKGRIKSGFKVNGNDVTAVEMDGGIIDAQGDVRIAGGINEGSIYARGSVYAKFIHNSEVVCMGDVVIQKEIVDSNIENSGSCVIENGKLISSKVTSKMGVTAKNIGTEMASPCVVKVGHDVFSEKELAKNQEAIDETGKQIEALSKVKDALKEENLSIQKQITDLAHIQDRSQLEEKQLQSQMAELEKKSADEGAVQVLRKKLDRVKENVAIAEKNLDGCFDKSEEIEEKLEAEDATLEKLEKEMSDLKEEKGNLIQWSKDNPGRSMVIVEGVLMTDTLIRGMHSEIRIQEVTRHARVTEVLCTSEDGQGLNIYEMQIGTI